MNRIFKIGLAILILGFIASTVFGLLSGTAFGSIYGDENYQYVKKTYAADQFTGFDFRLDNKAVIILFSESDNIEVEYYESDINWIVIDESTDVLSLDNESEWYANFVLGLNLLNLAQYSRLYLHLPRDVAYDLSVLTSNGRIELSDYANAGTIDFTTSNGDVTLTDVQAAESVHLSSSNGEIKITNFASPDILDVNTLNGKIDLLSVQALEITCDTSNGSIIGAGIDTDNLDCQTSNGNIEVSIIGSLEEYHLRMTTDNGNYYIDGTKVSLNNYNTDLTSELFLDSNNGNIRVNFTD